MQYVCGFFETFRDGSFWFHEVFGFTIDELEGF
jgi:hypothetical protein